MINPTTPQKKGDEINEIVVGLNARWDLNIPVWDALRSPAKAAKPDGTEDRILNTIRFLYWKNRSSMQQAVEKFEEHALPSDSSLRRESFLRRNELSDSAIHTLKETLLRFLLEAKDNPTVHVTTDSEHKSVEPPAETSSSKRTKQSRIQSFFAPIRNALPSMSLVQPEPPSSDDFGPDPEIAEIFNGLDMPDIQAPSTGSQLVMRGGKSHRSPRKPSIDEDVFTTPPTTPVKELSLDQSPLTKSNKKFEQNDREFLQRVDPIKLPEFTVPSRKRSIVEPSGVVDTRKVSREGINHQFPRVYGVNHLEPGTTAVRSFNSTRSFSSVTTASSTRTTPNTSFYVESPATSFNTDCATSDLTSLQLMREIVDDAPNKPQHLQFPAYDDPMDLDLDTEEEFTRLDSDSATTFPTPIKPQEESSYIMRYLDQHLVLESPFAPGSTVRHEVQFFKMTYEISRVAMHWKISPSELYSHVKVDTDDYGQLWTALNVYGQKHGKALPERSSIQAWKGAEGPGIVLTGELSFCEKPGGAVFGYHLNPLKLEKSHRLARRYGADRFIILGIPGLSPQDLPSYLRKDADIVRSRIVGWLVQIQHSLLGRKWKAFFVKAKPTTKSRRGNQQDSKTIRHRIYLFAEDGEGFITRKAAARMFGGGSKMAHTVFTVNELLDWVLPSNKNKDQSILKLFARLTLAVSTTVPTIEFRPREIIRSDDAFADSPQERRLDFKRHDAIKRGIKSKNKTAVMNDGCARISRPAAAAIANMLQLNGHIPCAFQGRIGGAKGMWIVDALGETLPRSERGFWIEITDSQLKFEGHGADELYPDPARVTFEVHSYARPLSPAVLNFQLMPILINRGVPAEEMMRLLEEDLTAKVADLEVAMDSGLALRKWNQDNNSITSERLRTRSIEMQGGIPTSSSEKINWFVEHGFEPKTCRYLKDLCYSAISAYCGRLEKRMNIGLGRSTYVYMIADPLAVLEENEVHFGFSNAFTDPKSQFQDTLLNAMDVLVARLPAHLPSDIQKVRAVFKPELGIYKDVIVFSSQGARSLADKLSGGDYDGDIAWVCWDPAVVSPFKNANVYSAPDLEYYGIAKDTAKYSEIVDLPDRHSVFLHKGFEFNLRPRMLGICTTYHERLCYHQKSIDDPIVKNIAVLLGYLVDSAKGGLDFTGQTWSDFLLRLRLPKRLPIPAYRSKGESRPSKHVVDRLVFEVAKVVVEKALESFTKHFAKTAVDWDDDLVHLWKQEIEEGKSDPALKVIHSDLLAKLLKVRDYWGANAQGKISMDGEDSWTGKTPFKEVVEQARELFLQIKPLQSSTHPTAKRWAKEDYGGQWTKIKASALFWQWHAGAFPWYVAGKELGAMKVERSPGGGARMVGELHVAMKLDGRFATSREDYVGAEGAGDGGEVAGEDAEEESVWDEFFDGDEFF